MSPADGGVIHVGGAASLGWQGRHAMKARLDFAFASFQRAYSSVFTRNPAPRTHFTDNIVRVGVNYHFGAPVVANY